MDGVVLENGSTIMKGGFIGDDAPRSIFSSRVGRHRGRSDRLIVGEDFLRAGDAVADVRQRPVVERGIVTDWHAMERLLHHQFFAELRAPPSENAVCHTESPTAPRAHRERLLELLFETFDTPHVQIVNSAKASLFASGRGTGLILDSGGGVTHAVALFEGTVMHHGVRLLDLAGNDVSDVLASHFPADVRRSDVAAVKQTMCQVRTEGSCANGGAYKLPDGTSLPVTAEALSDAPEIMFRPQLVGLEAPGVHEMVREAIDACDVDLRGQLFSSVVLAGRNTKLAGFDQRLRGELAALLSERPTTGGGTARVVAPPERQCTAWIGGSISASLTSTPWLSRAQYNEHGPTAAHTQFSDVSKWF
jgi:actin-related protein